MFYESGHKLFLHNVFLSGAVLFTITLNLQGCFISGTLFY